MKLTGLSERLVEQVELRIAELKEIVVKLEKEKELSAFDEGLIMKSINQYKEGFLRGSKDYHEDKVFCSINRTILLNPKSSEIKSVS
ncbi:MAG: hypothetical protein IPH33_18365 [Bacteroidetes bacterium]|nr:hypothetical protein [Bacteroidota bacterium]